MKELVPVSAMSPIRQLLIEDMAMLRFGEDIRDMDRFQPQALRNL